MIAQQQYIVFGRTNLGRPVDEIKQRVGSGDMVVVAAMYVVGYHLLLHSFLGIDGESEGVTASVLPFRNPGLHFLQIFHGLGLLLRVVKVIRVINHQQLLEFFLTAELILYGNLHLVVAGRVGSIELLDVIQNVVIQISATVSIKQNSIVGHLRLVRID